MMPALLLSLVCAAAPAPDTGGRMGVHGMVLFGAGEHLYLSHIPMFRRPHDYQLVLSVQLEHAELPPKRDYDHGLYTFLPEKLDLDALASGKLERFTGTIYQGSFEAEGQPLLNEVRVKVLAVVLAARLDTAAAPAATLGYLAVGPPDRLYLIHRHSAPPGFAQILVARAKGPLAVPAHGVMLTAARPDTEQKRLMPGTTERLRAPGGEVSLEILREPSLLKGPDFMPPAP